MRSFSLSRFQDSSLRVSADLVLQTRPVYGQFWSDFAVSKSLQISIHLLQRANSLFDHDYGFGGEINELISDILSRRGLLQNISAIDI